MCFIDFEKVAFLCRMLLSENYIQFVKEVTTSAASEYEVISIDDLALLPRKSSLSETSSNGIGSHDSGHDSYLDDGMFFSFSFCSVQAVYYLQMATRNSEEVGYGLKKNLK